MTEAREDLVKRLRALQRISALPGLIEAAADALEATPSASNDGLPEGWQANGAKRESDGARVKFDTFGTELRIVVNGKDYPLGDSATISLSEACLAANERFPVVKVGAARWRIEKRPFGTCFRSDGLLVVYDHAAKRWDVFDKLGWWAAFPTAEEAMAWADRERPVA